MGNYEGLKQAVSDVIKANGTQEITGNILQNTLLTIISTVGNGATFAGIATPTTNPGTPDQNVFWIASTPGEYVNFGGLQVKDDAVIFQNKNGIWESKNTGFAISSYVTNISKLGYCIGVNSQLTIDLENHTFTTDYQYASMSLFRERTQHTLDFGLRF